MKNTLEREVKLRAEAGFRLPPLSGRPLPERSFSSTYHDTLDHRLAAIGMTLRYRAENGGGAWQLKLPKGAARVELELPGGPDGVPPRFRDMLAATVRERQLGEVVTLDTVRRGVRIEQDGREIADVVVDQVVVRAGDAAVRAFDELEVELVDGDEADLRDLAEALRDAGARKGDQRPKLLHALGLDRSPPPVVDPRAPGLDQLSAMLQIQYQEILTHDPGTRLGADPEDLHQHRVAVRRLRALLRAARPMLDRRWVAGLRTDLAWLGQVLGEVRDLDVLLEHLEAESASLPPDDARAFSSILGILANRREAARGLMLAELREPRYLLLLERLEHELRHLPLSGATRTPASIADRERRRLRATLKGVDDGSTDEELHRARIDVKHARYAAELAQPGGGRATSRYVRAARRLQDVLGDHQDATVAEQRLRELAAAVADPRAALATGILIERQRARRRAAREELKPARRKLLRRGRKAWG